MKNSLPKVLVASALTKKPHPTHDYNGRSSLEHRENNCAEIFKWVEEGMGNIDQTIVHPEKYKCPNWLEDQFYNYDLVIIPGSPHNINGDSTKELDVLRESLSNFHKNKDSNTSPILIGFCYGFHALAEVNDKVIKVLDQCYEGEQNMLLKDDTKISVLVSHAQGVKGSFSDERVFAMGPDDLVYGMKFGNNSYGFQPHLEIPFRDFEKRALVNNFSSEIFQKIALQTKS